MKRFLLDVKTTLYASDGFMSLYRLMAAVAFIALVAISVAELVTGKAFEHYNEFALFTGSMATLSCGNKAVDKWGRKNDDE